MTELKNTLLILKTRWTEVVILLGLQILSFLPLPSQWFLPPKRYLAETRILLYLILPLRILVFSLSIILFSGFLRTIIFNPQKREPLVSLLKTGNRFFWRLLGFGTLFFVSCLILAWLSFSIAARFTSARVGFSEVEKTSPFFYQSCFVTAIMILAKLYLFIPAIIIILDCRLSDSFKLLKYCKLFAAKELVAMFGFQLVASYLWILLPGTHETATISLRMVNYISPTVQYLIMLIISVMAVRFVTSLNLPYDTEVRPLNSQGLLKPE